MTKKKKQRGSKPESTTTKARASQPRDIVIERSKGFKEQYASLPDKAKEAVKQAIQELHKNPEALPASLEKEKCRIKGILKKYGKVYFIHPTYRYRIAYSFNDDTIYLIDVGSRENYYSRLKRKGQ